MRHSPHYKRHEASYDRTLPYHRGLADEADIGDEDDVSDNADDIPSADEDDEEEMLIAAPMVYARDLPWTRHEVILSLLETALWCTASTCIALGPRVASPCAVTAMFSAFTWMASRALLLVQRTPMLVFGEDWRPYLRSVAFVGALGGFECSIGLWALAHCSAALVTLGRAAWPVAQLVVSIHIGIQPRRADLIATVALLSVGLALAAGDDRDASHWLHLLLLLAAAALGAARGGMLQQLLQARNVHPQLLLPRQTIATPLQLAHALAPWSMAVSSVLALLLETPDDWLRGVASAGAWLTSTAHPPPPPPPFAARRSAVVSMAAAHTTTAMVPSYAELVLLGVLVFASGLLSLGIIARASALSLTVIAGVHQAAVQQVASLAAARMAAAAGALIAVLPSSIQLSGLMLVCIATVTYGHLTIKRNASSALASGGSCGDSMDRYADIGSPNHGHGPPRADHGYGEYSGHPASSARNAHAHESWSIQRPTSWRRAPLQGEAAFSRNYGSQGHL
jgi:hypothetical protein